MKWEYLQIKKSTELSRGVLSCNQKDTRTEKWRVGFLWLASVVFGVVFWLHGQKNQSLWFYYIWESILKRPQQNINSEWFRYRENN